MLLFSPDLVFFFFLTGKFYLGEELWPVGDV